MSSHKMADNEEIVDPTIEETPADDVEMGGDDDAGTGALADIEHEEEKARVTFLE